MTRRFAWCCLIMVTLLALCCLSSVACTGSGDSPSVIQIVGGTVSIGGNEENTEHQTLRFKWQVKNNNAEEVLLQWVQPNLSDELANRLLTEDVKVNVGKVVSPGESIEVEGAITFDASGLSKQEILDECYITDVRVSMESTVHLPGEKRE